jgi:predicted nucleic acid-binding protein
MLTAFIDANVLFAAACSVRGASHEIIKQGLQGTIGLIVSELVIEEATRNVARKQPAGVTLLREIIEADNFIIIEPTKQEVIDATRYTVLKDAPIIAAAHKAKAPYLVSLDKHHLVRADVCEKVRQNLGIEIVTPETLLAKLRKTA